MVCRAEDGGCPVPLTGGTPARCPLWGFLEYHEVSSSPPPYSPDRHEAMKRADTEWVSVFNRRAGRSAPS